MKGPVLHTEDHGEIELPCKWAICQACQGEGKSSAYLGAFTQSDIDQMDHEFIDAYFAGRYDRPCEHCDGLGRVKVADLSKMTPVQRDLYRAQRKEEAEFRAIERMERKMGA